MSPKDPIQEGKLKDFYQSVMKGIKICKTIFFFFLFYWHYKLHNIF